MWSMRQKVSVTLGCVVVTVGVGAFVQIALQSLESPDRIWASLYQYDNLIDFTTGGNVEIILGGFKRVLPDGQMVPGKGYWAYMVEDGVIVP